jgi:hypothetical protein
MPRILSNKEALRAAVQVSTRARYADGKPVELLRPPEPPATPAEPDRIEQVVTEIKAALEAFAAKAAEGATQTPPAVVDTAELVYLLTSIAENTKPKPASAPAAKKVRFRVLERDERGRVLTFEAESS